MEETKIILPKLNLYSYELLMKSLHYYKNNSIEFSNDGDVTTDIGLLISHIEDNIQVSCVAKKVHVLKKSDT